MPFIAGRRRVYDRRYATSNDYHAIYSNIDHYEPRFDTAGSIKTILDNSNPQFRMLQKRGDVVLSDCSISEWRRTVTSGYISQELGIPIWWRGWQSGDLMYWVADWQSQYSPGFSANDELILLVSAYAKLKQSAVMSGEILSDLDKTVAMLRRPFSSARQHLTRMVKYRAKKRGKTATSAAKANASAWLEYRYGWKPIIADMFSVIDECHKVRDKCDQLRSVIRVGRKCSGNKSYSWPAASPHWRGGSWTTSMESSLNAGVIYDLKSRSTTEHLLAVMGLRPSDLPATVWEVIPYSFVLDWFVNVGEWIQAVTPVPGLTIRGHWVTKITNKTTNRSGYLDDKSTPTNWHGSLGGEEINTFDFIRTCNQELPSTPVLTMQPLSALHAVDAAALLLNPILNSLKSFRH